MDSTDLAPEAASPSRFRVRLGLGMTLFGFIVFMIGARPALFFLDRSPVVGFIQIAVFLVGLALICVGGYVSLMAFWQNGERTIAADIGQRLVATGYVIAVFSGMADIFGLGTRPPPVYVPYFGPLQAVGVEIGMGIIIMGFLLLVPFKQRKSPPPPAA
ncbi:MAG: hypothetical protein QMD04_11650 [Anaerolineales bacterium]|nr:hypothetical protein [Anaerolineales bacterium]